MNNNTPIVTLTMGGGLFVAPLALAPARWFYRCGGPHGWLRCSAEAAATWHLAGVPVRLSHHKP